MVGLLCAGCPIGHRVYRCDADEQCGAGGACESDRYCSFSDPDCSSARRYDDTADTTVAGDCVPVCIDAAVDIAAGANHTCVVSVGGVLVCWGDNDTGQLGRAVDSGSTVAVPTPEPADRWVEVAAGTSHTCAITDAGNLYCWGENASDKLGPRATGEGGPTPLLVDDGSPATVAIGGDHGCAVWPVGNEDELRCWGSNQFGQLGVNPPRSAIPTPVGERALGVVGLAGGDHTCIMRGQTAPFGAVCCGRNDRGQLGDPAAGAQTNQHRPPSGLAAVRDLSAGANHTCAVEGITALCWGANDAGQADPLTAGSDIDTPVVIDGLPGAARGIAAGGRHSCAIVDPDREVWCWGDLDRDGSASTPAPIEGLVDAVQISSGDAHGCARLDDGTIDCWEVQAPPSCL